MNTGWAEKVACARFVLGREPTPDEVEQLQELQQWGLGFLTARLREGISLADRNSCRLLEQEIEAEMRKRGIRID
jgi:hypothetical protein